MASYIVLKSESQSNALDPNEMRHPDKPHTVNNLKAALLNRDRESSSYETSVLELISRVLECSVSDASRAFEISIQNIGLESHNQHLLDTFQVSDTLNHLLNLSVIKIRPLKKILLELS